MGNGKLYHFTLRWGQIEDFVTIVQKMWIQIINDVSLNVAVRWLYYCLLFIRSRVKTRRRLYRGIALFYGSFQANFRILTHFTTEPLPHPFLLITQYLSLRNKIWSIDDGAECNSRLLTPLPPRNKFIFHKILLHFLYFFRRVHKLRKASISFVMSVRPSSVRKEQLGSKWMDFHEVWYFSIFPKICWENSRFIKIEQE